MKRYLKILLAVLAAAVLFAALGLAACGGDTTKYKIEVDCGTGGSYTLSEESPVPENVSVTLTVTPDEGFAVDKVTVNGKEVSLIGSRYILRMTGDKAVVITFKPTGDTAEKYTVTVTCGAGGDYSLTPEAESYEKNSPVTLKVTPDGGFAVKSVEIDGEEVTLQEGEYTFEVVSNVKITIEFAKQFSRDKYVGTWTSVASSGTIADELVIGEDSFTFNEKSYTLTAESGGYAFTVVEGGDVFDYYLNLEEVGEEKYILVLTVSTPTETLTEYCIKSGTDYSVDFPEELQGDWDAGPANYPINIGADRLTIGSDRAIVLFYDAPTKTYTLVAGGIEYTLVWDEAAETLTLTIAGDAASASVYTKAIPPEEAFFTELAGYYYTNGEHTVQIGEDGAFTFDGTKYSVLPVDSADTKFGYTFRKNGDLWHIIKATAEQFLLTDASYSDEITCRRVTGTEAYTITVTYPDGEYGTCDITPPKNGGNTYSAYEQVTITITPNADYVLNIVWMNSVNNVTKEFEDGSYTFYISRNTEFEIKFISRAVAESIFPTSYIGNIYYGDDWTVFSIKFEADKVTLILDSVSYEIAAEDVTVTDSEKKTFTFNVTIDGYGVVTVQCNTISGVLIRFSVTKEDGTLLGTTYTGKSAEYI